jgi:hypothetical protein
MINMATKLAGNESPIEQRRREKIPYRITTTPWTAVPTEPYILIEDVDQGYLDVTVEMCGASPTVTVQSPSILLLPKIYSPRARNLRLNVGWKDGDAEYEAFWDLKVKL